jgi:hypothetical protein
MGARWATLAYNASSVARGGRLSQFFPSWRRETDHHRPTVSSKALHGTSPRRQFYGSCFPDRISSGFVNLQDHHIETRPRKSTHTVFPTCRRRSKKESP